VFFSAHFVSFLIVTDGAEAYPGGEIFSFILIRVQKDFKRLPWKFKI